MTSYFIKRLFKRNYLYSKRLYPFQFKSGDEKNRNGSIIDWDIVNGKKKVIVTVRKMTVKDRMKRRF